MGGGYSKRAVPGLSSVSARPAARTGDCDKGGDNSPAHLVYPTYRRSAAGATGNDTNEKPGLRQTQ